VTSRSFAGQALEWRAGNRSLLQLEHIGVRFALRASSYVSVAILSSAITALVGYTTWSPMTTSSALTEEPPARLEKATKEMTPDRALAVALKSLADANFKLFDSYKIVMTTKENELSWGVWFVALPETPGMDIYVAIENDGSASILPGR
jgi:hypothetical protein